MSDVDTGASGLEEMAVDSPDDRPRPSEELGQNVGPTDATKYTEESDGGDDDNNANDDGVGDSDDDGDGEGGSEEGSGSSEDESSEEESDDEVSVVSCSMADGAPEKLRDTPVNLTPLPHVLSYHQIHKINSQAMVSPHTKRCVLNVLPVIKPA